MKNYARNNIVEMEGYVPGEQPKDRPYIKLNANENAYPPSPTVGQALAEFAASGLRVYPDPVANALRDEAARLAGLPGRDWVACGNGSDDLLTMGIRTFVDQGKAIASFEPSYSLYPILANIQGARCRLIRLTPTFDLPVDAARQADGCAILFVVRPNAPTGNAFPLADVRHLCETFEGIVWIDEAYADFAADNCLGFVQQYDNVVVSRTFSKSYSLAAARLGLGFANPKIIAQMLKVRDSYNVGIMPQVAGLAALRDQAYMEQVTERIRRTRETTSRSLETLGIKVFPSQANFILCRPPMPAETFFLAMREEGILIRFFSGESTRDFVRISIGTEEEMQQVVAAAEKILANGPITQGTT